MSIAGRLGAVYFTRSQQFHQAPHSGCSFLSSPLTKVTQGLQQCRPSYCIAYHFKPLDAAPWGAARGLFRRIMLGFLFKFAVFQTDVDEMLSEFHQMLRNFVRCYKFCTVFFHTLSRFVPRKYVLHDKQSYFGITSYLLILSPGIQRTNGRWRVDF